MAAAARPYWTGLLKPSLVTIAVRLYPAEAAQESFLRSAPWGRVIPGRGLSPRARNP